MEPMGEVGADRFVDHAVDFDAALAAKGLCDNLYAEMGLPLRARAGVALVPVGLVDYLKPRGRKSLG
jgi:hypothetical protein